MKRIRKGDIVQVTDKLHEWYPALLIVEKLHAASVAVYSPALIWREQEGVRMSLDITEFEPVGTAKITVVSRVLTTAKKEEKP